MWDVITSPCSILPFRCLPFKLGNGWVTTSLFLCGCNYLSMSWFKFQISSSLCIKVMILGYFLFEVLWKTQWSPICIKELAVNTEMGLRACRVRYNLQQLKYIIFLWNYVLYRSLAPFRKWVICSNSSYSDLCPSKKFLIRLCMHSKTINVLIHVQISAIIFVYRMCCAVYTMKSKSKHTSYMYGTQCSHPL